MSTGKSTARHICNEGDVALKTTRFAGTLSLGNGGSCFRNLQRLSLIDSCELCCRFRRRWAVTLITMTLPTPNVFLTGISTDARAQSVGTLLKASGEAVKVVQELMRHADISATMNIYTKALTPAKREAQPE